MKHNCHKMQFYTVYYIKFLKVKFSVLCFIKQGLLLNDFIYIKKKLFLAIICIVQEKLEIVVLLMVNRTKIHNCPSLILKDTFFSNSIPI